MKCPFCGGEETKVIDSRATNEGAIIRRRRECLKCKFRFSTHEELELLQLMVVKKNGNKETYDRNKIITGLNQACEKRSISENDILRIVNYVEQDILNLDKNEIESKEIGNLAVNYLKEIDEVAYLRFASVYKNFKNAYHFECELKKLENKNGKPKAI
ncbi:MAG: transcriptional repressor NrdR [Parcubacteria group bacterium]|nr:transcriptional repressor NrdR [Parcubacteria group bacterium]